MRIYVYFLCVCVWAGGHAQETTNSNPAQSPARGNEPHMHAQLAVQAEQARTREPLCPRAMTTRDINECYSAELATTDENYSKLVRALSVLLHPGDKTETTSSPSTIPFDDAEAAWLHYRKLSCEAARDVYTGTIRTSMQLGCQITLARHHMDELWVVYSEVGMH